ncbi:MAG: hypothetical protein WC942_09450 [Clostridia bacterium]|jgi:RNAse (barnase) inhibitor barstar
MSNEITIQTTEFKNVPQNKVSFGVRIFDDYDQDYDNTWDCIPGNLDDNYHEKILYKCMENHSFDSFFEFIKETEKGIFINDDYYPWEKIKHCFENF